MTYINAQKSPTKIQLQKAATCNCNSEDHLLIWKEERILGALCYPKNNVTACGGTIDFGDEVIS